MSPLAAPMDSLMYEIERELTYNHESWSDVIGSTIDDKAMRKRFDPRETPLFHVWTTDYVYFPYYDDEWCKGIESAPRNPPDAE